jgi:hypothetical protein
MPAEYEKIRDSELKRGASIKDAKRIAAATYNKRHPGQPMSNQHHASLSSLRKKRRG